MDLPKAAGTTFASFALAAAQAKAMIKELQRPVQVRRCDGGWEVVPPPSAATSQKEPVVALPRDSATDKPKAAPAPAEETPVNAALVEEALDWARKETDGEAAWDPGDSFKLDKDDTQIIDELQSDTEDYARSDEDGWFYPD